MMEDNISKKGHIIIIRTIIPILFFLFFLIPFSNAEEEIITRGLAWDDYYNPDTNEHRKTYYAGVVNIEDENGTIRPFEEVVNFKVGNGMVNMSYLDYSVAFSPLFVMQNNAVYYWGDIPNTIEKNLWKKNYRGKIKYGVDFNNVSDNIKNNIKYVVLHREGSTGLTWDDVSIEGSSIVVKNKIRFSHDDILQTYTIPLINKTDIVIGNLDENFIANDYGTWNISFDPEIHNYNYTDETYTDAWQCEDDDDNTAPPVNTIFPTCVDTFSEITSETGLHADDASYVSSGGGLNDVSYHVFRAVVQETVGDITLLNWTYNGDTEYGAQSMKMYMWNSSSGKWVLCFNFPLDPDDTGYCSTTDAADFINATSYAQIIVHAFISSGTTKVETDYVKLEVTYTLNYNLSISNPTSSSPVSVNDEDNITITFDYFEVDGNNVTSGVSMNNVTIGGQYVPIINLSTCSGTPTPCVILNGSQANCEGGNCSYTTGSCGGSGDCPEASNEPCCVEAGCSWSSCPFIYSWNGTNWHREYEGFPPSGFGITFGSTTHTLFNSVCEQGERKIQIAERLNEESKIEEVTLYEVPFTEKPYKDHQGNFLSLKNEVTPSICFLNEKNCLENISYSDDLLVTSAYYPKIIEDVLILEFDNPNLKEEMTLYFEGGKTNTAHNWGHYLISLIGSRNLVSFIGKIGLLRNFIRNFYGNILPDIYIEEDNEWVLKYNLKNYASIYEDGREVTTLKINPREKIRIKITGANAIYRYDKISATFGAERIKAIEINPNKILFNGIEDNTVKKVLNQGDVLHIYYNCNENTIPILEINGNYLPYEGGFHSYDVKKSFIEKVKYFGRIFKSRENLYEEINKDISENNLNKTFGCLKPVSLNDVVNTFEIIPSVQAECEAGSPTCSGIDDMVCCEDLTCDWTNATCTGVQFNCDTYTTSSNCTAHGCEWSGQQFAYESGVGWQVNVTVPSGLSGLQDLFLNATYSGIIRNHTQVGAVSYQAAVSYYFKNVSESLSLTEFSLRPANSFREEETSLTTLDLITKLPNFIKPIVESFQLSEFITRLSIFFRRIIESFDIGEFITYLKEIPKKLILETINITKFIERQFNSFRNILQSVNLSEFIYYLRDIPKKLITEIVNISDFITRLSISFRTILEQINITELIYRFKEVALKTLTETLNFSDFIDRLSTTFRTILQNISINDFIDRLFVSFRKITETLNITDFIKYLREIPKAVTEIFNINDFIDRIFISFRNIADTINIADFVDYVKEIPKKITETINISDFIDRLFISFRKILESLNISDFISRLSSSFRKISETLNISDLITRLSVTFRKILETININDFISRLSISFREILQDININDFINYVREIPKAVLETFNINEFIDRLFISFRKISESINIDDFLFRFKGVLKTLTETLNINEFIDRLIVFGRAILQSINMSEFINRIFLSFREISETFNINEFITYLREIPKKITEIINLSDFIERISNFFRRILEPINFLEFIFQLGVTPNLRTIFETLNINDFISRLSTWFRETTHSFNLSEFLYKSQVFLAKTISETFKINDFISRFASFGRNISETLTFSISTLKETLTAVLRWVLFEVSTYISTLYYIILEIIAGPYDLFGFWANLTTTSDVTYPLDLYPQNQTFNLSAHGITNITWVIKTPSIPGEINITGIISGNLTPISLTNITTVSAIPEGAIIHGGMVRIAIGYNLSYICNKAYMFIQENSQNGALIYTDEDFGKFKESVKRDILMFMKEERVELNEHTLRNYIDRYDVICMNITPRRTPYIIFDDVAEAFEELGIDISKGKEKILSWWEEERNRFLSSALAVVIVFAICFYLYKRKKRIEFFWNKLKKKKK